MAARYLLDTNIASYIIKRNVPEGRRRLRRHAMSDIAISSITEGELSYGVSLKPSAIRLGVVVEEFLLRVTILPWDSLAAREYGQLRATLEQAGEPMGNLDLMIGAHAMAAGLTLVTNDRAFTRIKGLKIQDWTKP
jgi:tRNA(fMet)-specific endonuclease VapC